MGCCRSTSGGVGRHTPRRPISLVWLASKRLIEEIDRRGTIDVLRRGTIDLVVVFKLAYFKPTHGLTPSIGVQYDANRLTITRQLPFGPDDHKTLDVALFINGLPVADVELKNPLSGQDIDNAIEQYRKDRDPKASFFARRSVVHCAVDPGAIAVTTALAGKDTVFIPFNQGDDNGAGNPADPAGGYRTRYLWERVWQRDASYAIGTRRIERARAFPTALASAITSSWRFPLFRNPDSATNP